MKQPRLTKPIPMVKLAEMCGRKETSVQKFFEYRTCVWGGSVSIHGALSYCFGCIGLTQNHASAFRVPAAVCLRVRAHCKQKAISIESFWRESMKLAATAIRRDSNLLYESRPFAHRKGTRVVLRRMRKYLWCSARVIAYACRCKPGDVFGWAAELYFANMGDKTDDQTM